MKPKTVKIIKYSLAGVYAAVMLVLLFGRTPAYFSSISYFEHLRYNINIVPFATLSEYFGYLFDGGYMVRHAIINLGGNIVMFIPLGFFLALLWGNMRKLLPHLLTTAAIIASVELLQLFTLRGSADVDDLLLNVIGSAVGYLLYMLWRYIYKKIKPEINNDDSGNTTQKQENQIGKA